MSPRKTPFKKEHEIQYALKISEIDPETNEVSSVVCQLCAHFGREEKIGAKRKRTTNIKYFKRPFRPDIYRQHLQQQHPERWNLYCISSTEEKKAFFSESNERWDQYCSMMHEKKPDFLTRSIKETLFVDTSAKINIKEYDMNNQVPIQLNIDQDIVDVLLEEILFNPEIDEVPHNEAFLMFIEHFEHANPNGSLYFVEIENSLRFHLAIDYLSAGLTFQQASAVFQTTKEKSNLTSIENVTSKEIANFVRLVCALNFQKLKHLLNSCWTFSIAIDTRQSIFGSHLDLQVRLFLKDQIENYHIVALPIARQTGESMFDIVRAFMDVLCPLWKEKIIGIASNGKNSITEQHIDLSNRIEQVAKPGFVKIWYKAQRLDQSLQECLKHILDERFYAELKTLTAYLCRQYALEKEIGSKCPSIQNTRWISLKKITKWLKENRIKITTYLNEKQPGCSPSKEFWILVMVVNEILERVSITFETLQGMNSLHSQQRNHLQHLASFFIEVFSVLCLLPHVIVDDTVIKSTDGRFCVYSQNIKEHLEDMGFFVVSMMKSMGHDHLQYIIESIALTIVNLVASITRIFNERETNDYSDVIPSVLPSGLVKLRGSQFTAYMLRQKGRCSVTYSLTDLDHIEAEFGSLINAYRSELELKEFLDNVTSDVTFSDAWKPIYERFPLLHQFCGGIATVFPDAALYDDTDLVFNTEYDDFHTNLVNFSLEGILHAKQYSRLSAIM